MTRPIPFQALDDCLVPRRNFQSVFAREFVPGRVYVMVEQEESSDKQRAFFFATVKDMWATLPDELARQFVDPDALRKHSLIRCGYAHIYHVACADDDEAMRAASSMKPHDNYAIITVTGRVVSVATAKSQKRPRGNGEGMAKAEFQESANAVLDFIRDMLGVKQGESA